MDWILERMPKETVSGRRQTMLFSATGGGWEHPGDGGRLLRVADETDRFRHRPRDSRVRGAKGRVTVASPPFPTIPAGTYSSPAEAMVTARTGRSMRSQGVFSTAVTNSLPSRTSPKTTCLPSSLGSRARVGGSGAR